MIKHITQRLLPIAIAALLLSPAVLAQNVTSAGVQGTVFTASGKPAANVIVTITDTQTHATRTLRTNTEGRYNAPGLQVGGPYTVTIVSGGKLVAKRSGIFLDLGTSPILNFTEVPVSTRPETLQTVSVIGSAPITSSAMGLSTSISAQRIKETPNPGRVIANIARLNPMISNTNQGDEGLSLSLAGLNTRFNNITVDGISQNDTYGLNSSGLPTTGSPVSPNAIAGYKVSATNFDASEDTVGASINAVIKSGTNHFHGSLYDVYNNAHTLVGGAGWEPNSPGYTGFGIDQTRGGTLSGPIVKNRLFFFINIEKEDTDGIGASEQSALNPALGNGPSTSQGVSPGDIARIDAIAAQLGLHPGSVGSASGVLADRRYIAKINWILNSKHRGSFTYQSTTETQPIVEGDFSNSVSFNSYWHTRTYSLKNLSFQSFDNWSNNFSTQTKIAYQNYFTNEADPFEQPSVTVALGTTPNGVPNGTSPDVDLGTFQFFQINNTDVKTYNFFTEGSLFVGNHEIKGGFSFQRNIVDDNFDPDVWGQYTFWGIQNFQSAKYDVYNLATPRTGGTLADLAGRYKLNQYALFLQDTWQPSSDFALLYGLRFDKDYTNDSPTFNPEFVKAFGMTNANTINGDSLLEPRVSFTYRFNDASPMSLHGGLGLFQTSTPAVWLANTYANTGLNSLTFQSFGDDPSAPAFSPDASAQNQPSSPTAQLMDVDALGQNFVLPSAWKASLAFSYQLPWWHTIFSAQALYIKPRSAMFFIASNLGAPDATLLPDGRNQYWRLRGQAPISSDARASANRLFSGDSTVVTNTDKGYARSFTLSLEKPFAHGWFGLISATLTHSRAVTPGQGTLSQDNFSENAYVNPNEEVAVPSPFSIAKRFNVSLSWQHHFFGSYITRVSAFLNVSSSLPYSWVFGNDANGDSFASDLAFIPKPGQVGFAPGTQQRTIDQFYDFIAGNSYLRAHAGGIATPFGANGGWTHELDVSFTQQVPGLFKGNLGHIRFDIHNFLNLLNDHWGLQELIPTSGGRTLADYDGVKDGKYVYSLPTDGHGNYAPEALAIFDGASQNVTNIISRWSVQVTLSYSF